MRTSVFMGRNLCCRNRNISRSEALSGQGLSHTGICIQETIMASPYSTPQRAVVVVPRVEEPMPAGATGTLFLLASGFGIGALVILFAFVFLIGIGGVGHDTSGTTPAAQSAATAPAAPGPAPNPAPNTGGSTVTETTGQAPAPANPNTPRAPTQGQK
jgi:hypothetical protein